MTTRSPTARDWTFLALSLPIVALLGLAYRLRWTCDDAFVSFRVVGLLLAGNGPNFNVGERVEAYTNALWVAVLAAISAIVGLEHIERVSVIAGILLTSGGLLLSMLASMRLFRADGVTAGPWAPFMCLTLVGMRAFQEYASSGLETGLSFFLLGLSLWMLFRPDQRHFLATAFVIGLLPLNRPDFGIYWAVFGLYLIFRARAHGPLRLAALALALLALPAGYQIFRMGYFAALVPNTALAKEASLAYWERGFRYLENFLSTYRLEYLLPAYAALAVWISLRIRARLLGQALIVCSLAAGLHATYIVRVGGDFMHARMLLTDYFLLVAPLAVIPILARQRSFAMLFASVLAWSTLSLVRFELPYQGIDAQYYINDERSIWAGQLGKDNPINVVDLSQPRPVPDGVRYAISGNAGIAGFRLVKYGLHDVRFLDWCGLGDPIISRQLWERRIAIGHEKCHDVRGDPWIAARFADGGFSTASRDDVALAREVIGNSVLGEYLDAITRPLTLSGFVHNLANARTYTRIRVAPIARFREVPQSERNASTFDRMLLQRERLAGADVRAAE